MSQYSLKVNKELEQRFCITDLSLGNKFLQKKNICRLRQTKDAYHFTVCMSQVSGEQFKLVTLSLVFHWVFLEKLARACRQWKTLLELVNLLGFCRILVVLVTCSFSNVKLISSKAAIRKASTGLQCFSPPCLRSSLFLQSSIGYKSDHPNGKGWQGMSARNWKFGGCPAQPFREKITPTIRHPCLMSAFPQHTWHEQPARKPRRDTGAFHQKAGCTFPKEGMTSERHINSLERLDILLVQRKKQILVK